MLALEVYKTGGTEIYNIDSTKGKGDGMELNCCMVLAVFEKH